MSRLAVALAGLLMAATTSEAQGLFPFNPRFKLLVNGAFDLGPGDFTDSRTFTQFAEQGNVQTQYTNGARPGFDLGLRVKITQHIGAMASFSLTTKAGTARYSGSFPSPLYLNQPRQVSGDLTGLSHKETTEHVALTYVRTFHALDLTLFGGLSLFHVDLALVQNFLKTEKYPFDTVTIAGVVTKSLTDSPLGFNVGAGLDYRIGLRFGVGAQLRYSHATATLTPIARDKVSLDAGGLQVAAGGRISF
jgi:opacity protein-like surface antigen